MLRASIRSVAFDSTSDFALGRLYLRVIFLIWLPIQSTSILESSSASSILYKKQFFLTRGMK